jgi:cytochrome c oxidase subunit 3
MFGMPGSISAETIRRGGGPPIGDGGFGDFGRPGGMHRRASITGAYLLLAAVTMFFAALTSSLIVRRGLGDDWASFPLPGILWWNTAVLVASSACVELARRALRSGARPLFNRYWTVAAVLGAVFLGGQYVAWTELRASGIYMATSPNGSFFYLLTIAHAVHVAGGLMALLYIESQALRLQLGPAKRTAVEVSSLYWHFMGGLWIYLMLLLRIWG